MKRTLFSAIVMIFTLSSTMAFATNKDVKTEVVPVKTENQLTAEEVSHLTKRVEEIRDMDKSEMKAKERKELRKEVKMIKSDLKKSGNPIYIGGASLLLIIILILILI